MSRDVRKLTCEEKREISCRNCQKSGRSPDQGPSIVEETISSSPPTTSSSKLNFFGITLEELQCRDRDFDKSELDEDFFFIAQKSSLGEWFGKLL